MLGIDKQASLYHHPALTRLGPLFSHPQKPSTIILCHLTAHRSSLPVSLPSFCRRRRRYQTHSSRREILPKIRRQRNHQPPPTRPPSRRSFQRSFRHPQLPLHRYGVCRWRQPTTMGRKAWKIT
jgi:hypothetical protein